MNNLQVPADFNRTIVELFGERGVQWLHHLAALISDCERRWSLTVQPPFPLSYNYVAPAVQANGTEVVLKLGVPNPELFSEMAALRLFDGHGIVRLLDANPEQGIMLLERLNPGTMLANLEDDQQATSIAAGVMRQLWRPLPLDHPFPSLPKWTSGIRRLRSHFNGGCGPFPPALVEAAEKLFAELIASSAEPVLLHGDLHHFNILTAERQPWLALDPKGVAGEPAFEVGPLLYNFPQDPSLSNIRPVLRRRVDQLAEELGFDRERIIGWGLAQSVLSAWWSYEDHGHGWEEAINVAEHLAELR